MGIRIQHDNIIDYIIKKTGLTGNAYLLGTLDCRFSYKEYAKKHPEFKDKFPYQKNNLMDTKDYFRSKGFSSVKTIDVNERADLKIDLNFPIIKKYHEVADWVINFGTLEHIFNVAEAVSNAYRMLKVSGIVVNIAPFSIWDHGYYNFNPKFFDEFFLRNFCEVILKTYQITIINPFYTRFTSFLPPHFGCFNLPFKSNISERYFKSIAYRFGMPYNTKFICAYIKKNGSKDINMPYDISD